MSMTTGRSESIVAGMICEAKYLQTIITHLTRCHAVTVSLVIMSEEEGIDGSFRLGIVCRLHVETRS
jgi:hypothetical protein